ncbi:MAG: hypothetical protein WCT32_03490 [Patescibacteria group bacterium]|jgi:hypothetical protein
MVNYNYLTENEKASAFVKDLTLNLKPEDAVLVSQLTNHSQHATGEHYTFSSILPLAPQDQIKPISRKLAEIDSTLILNEPELYHISTFWCPINHDTHELIQLIKTEVAKEPITFHLHGLIAAPFGISLKAYPLNDTFVRLREKLCATTEIEIPRNEDGSYHERFVSSWITLARYTQPPQEPLLEYIRSNLELDFGEFTPREIGAYISNNKFLRDPKVIEMIPNFDPKRQQDSRK